jgi:hypothetical protein
LEIEERVAAEHGRGTVKIPAQSTGYEVLRELLRSAVTRPS